MSQFLDNPEAVKGLFKEIADIKMKRKELDDELATKESIAYAFMDKQKSDKIETDFGSFTRIRMNIWEFSPAVKAAKDGVKELEASEKESGLAKVKTVRQSLRFNSPKDKE